MVGLFQVEQFGKQRNGQLARSHYGELATLDTPWAAMTGEIDRDSPLIISPKQTQVSAGSWEPAKSLNSLRKNNYLQL